MPIQFEDPFADPNKLNADTDPRTAPSAQPEQEGSVLADLALSPLRGADQFLRGVAGLGNIVPGVDYDTEGHTFGEAKTGVGAFATGLFEFGAGFVPGVGIAGKLGKLASVSKFSKVAAVGRKLSDGSSILRGAVAGGIQDFISYGGQEERLSDLVQSHPGLANPITDYLSSDEDDSELEGRFKNVLEGAGLGIGMDVLLGGLKALKAGRAAKIAGEDPEAAFRAAADASGMDRSLETMSKRLDGDPTQAGQDAVDAARRADPELGPLDEGAIRKDAADTARGGPEAPEPKLAKDAPEPKTPEATLAEALSVQDTEAFTEALIKRKAQTPKELVELMEEGGANMSRFVSERSVPEAIRAIEDTLGTGATKIPHAEQLEQAAESLAKASSELGDINGMDPQVLATIATSRQGAQDIVQVNRNVLAAQSVQMKLGAELGAAAADTPIEDLRQMVGNLDEIGKNIRGITSELGRGLQAQQVPAGELGKVADIAKDMTDDQLRKFVDKLQTAHASGGVEGMAGLARTMEQGSKRGKFLGVVNELFINNMLGGARTLVVNGLSPIMMSVTTPLQNIVGGALTRNSDVVQEGLREIMSLTDAMGESFAMARKAFKTGEGQLLPLSSIRDDPGRFTDAISAGNLGLDEDGAVGGVVNFIGKAIRMPTRVLGSTDEFVKQMNYRAVSKSRLVGEAMSQGLDPQAAAEFVTDGMSKLMIDGQAATTKLVTSKAHEEAAKLGLSGPEALSFVDNYVSENWNDSLSTIADAGSRRADDVSFTGALGVDPQATAEVNDKLRSASLGLKVQNISNSVPLAKLVVPFVKTPANIATNAAQRVDVLGITETLMKTRFFTKEAPELSSSVFQFSRDMASGDPRRKAEAVGRISTGVATVSSFAVMASKGELTGRGPSDPEQRRLLMEAGWQPYSIRTGDGYVSYARLDPFATIIGTVADLHDYGRYSDETDQEGLQTAFMAGAFAVANNVTNKTYLQGLGDFIGAMSDTDKKLKPFLQQTVTTLAVPQSLGQFAGLDDPHMREFHSLGERMRRRIPGMADDLSPMRNVLGEPITKQKAQFSDHPATALWDIMTPLAYRESSDDEITKEMANLRHGFNPPRKAIDGIDLLEHRSPSGQTAHDRWLQLHGEVRVSGRTLRQELKTLIRGPQYQTLSDQGDGSGPSPRVQAVRSVINRFRGVARDQMEREYPELRQALRDNERSRLALRGSGQSSDSNLFRL